MATKVSIEEEVKKLQKHVGGMAKMFKDLKHSVEVLEKKVSANENDEIKQILDAQTVIDEILVANSDAIKRINKEIKELSKKDVVTDARKDTLESINHGQDGQTKSRKSKKDVVSDGTKDTLESINCGQEGESKRRKICRYYNRGYCKYESECRFFHSNTVCQEHVDSGYCSKKECNERHIKTCKWIESRNGCRRTNCEYLHNKTNDSFKCSSCLDTWKDRTCVKEHLIENRVVYFCLNCDDWIRDKSGVFRQGWTLLDDQGYLRTGI